MWRYGSFPVLAAAMLLCPVLAAAMPVQGLYGAAVPVEARTAEPDPEALRAALTAVLVKITGLRDVAVEPAALAVLETPERYLQQHGYTAAGEIWIGFDPLLLRGDVLAAGLPLWGEDRPATIVWLALELADSERSLLGADDDSGVARRLLDASARRGLPLVLPLLDSADLARVTFSDVWGGFEFELAEASRRYAADALLVGRARGPDLDTLFVEWRLSQGEESESWRGTLEDGVERAADSLSRRFASIAGSGEQRLPVMVSGVDGVDAYARVLAYFEGLSLVSNVSVQQVRDDTVRYVLTTLGEPAKLRSQIDLASFLAVAGAGAAAPAGQPPGLLRYEYRRQPR